MGAVFGQNGIAEVIQGNRKLGIQERKAQTEEERLQQERRQKIMTNARKAIADSVKTAQGILQNADTRGIPRDDPRVQKALQTVMQPAVEASTTANQLGLAVPQPEQIQQRFQTMLQTTPTPGEEQAVEARGAGLTAQAEAAGEAAGTPEEIETSFRARVRGFDQPLEVLRSGDRLFIQQVDEQGRVQRLPVASEDVNRIEATEDIENRQPFTREEFIQPVTQQPQVDFEKGVGPLDAASRVISGTPVFGQILGELGGEEAGQEQRRANAVFQGLENRVLSAFRPGLGGRISNFEMQQAQKEVPQFGAFATERATLTDLKTLKERAQSLMDQSLQIANNPNRFDDELVKDAQARLQSLGEVISITDSLINAGDTPEMEVLRTVGKPINEVETEDLNRLGEQIGKGEVQMSEQATDVLINQLSDEQLNTLMAAAERTGGRE